MKQPPTWLRGYTFDLKAIRTHARDCLYEYMKVEMNTELLDFVETLDLLISKCEANTLAACDIEQLVTTFLQQGAKREVNISAASKRMFDEIHPEQQQYTIIRAREIFACTRSAVEIEVRKDILPRFFKSDIWISFASKKGVDWAKKHGRFAAAEKYSLTDEDFKNPYITKRDAQFMKAFWRDSYDWKLMGWDKKQRISCYTSSRAAHFLPEISWVKRSHYTCKYVGIIPASMEKVEKSLFTIKVPEYDPNTKLTEAIEVYTYDQLKEKFPNSDCIEAGSVVVNVEVRLDFPFYNRSWVYATSMQYSEDGTELYWYGRHYEKPDFKRPKHLVPSKLFILFMLKKIDEGTTLVEQMIIMDLGTKALNKIGKYISFKRAKACSVQWYNYISKQPDDAEEDLNDPIRKMTIDSKLMNEKKSDETRIQINV